ncbi:MAG: ATP-binding protein [Bacteroidales bacterium]|nr:ATP-binding protein [Bacteroidales bacterium]
MKLRRVGLIISVILNIALISGFSQTNAEYNAHFTRLNVMHGLSHNSSHTIYQDKNGKIWIGTENGLNSYNGYEIIPHPMILNDSLTYCKVKTIVEYNGEIVFGTIYHGMIAYNPQNNTFRAFEFEEFNSDEIGSVFDIDIDKEGNLWVASVLEGFFYVDIQNKVHRIDFDKDYWPRHIYFAANNTVWLTTWRGGAKIYNKNTGELNTLVIKGLKKPKKSPIYCIKEDSFGNYYLATWGSGLIQVTEMKDSVAVKWNEVLTVDNLYKNSRHITSIIIDNNRIIVGSTNGLHFLNPKTKDWTQGFNHTVSYNKAMHSNSISSNIILYLLKDYENNIWISTRNYGVNVYTHRKNFVHNYTFAKINAQTREVNCLYQYNENNLVVSTQQLAFFNLKSRTFTNKWAKEYVGINFIQHNIPFHDASYVKDIEILGKTYVFLNIEHRSLVLLNKEKLREGTLEYRIFDIKEKFYGRLTSVESDIYGNIWTGNDFGLGMLRLRQDTIDENNSIPMFETISYFAYDSPLTSAVSSLYRDKDNNMWLASRDGNVVCYPPQENVKLQDLKTKKLPTELEKLMVNCICEDDGDAIWFGTYNSGLIQYFKKQKTIKSYHHDQGLNCNFVNSFIKDEQGFVWLGTDNGIFRFDPSKPSGQQFFNINETDGMKSQYCTKAAIKAKNNALYFGTLEGMVSFQPEDFVQNTQVPKMEISEIQIYNRDIPSKSKFFSINQQNLTDENKIMLQPQDYAIHIKFASLSYQNPEKNSFAYRLNGLSSNWNYVTAKQRSAYFQNLTPGKYLFEVKCSNNDGVWNNDAIKLQLVVKPAFYKTFYFKILIAAIACLLIGGIFYYRVKSLQKRNALLNIMVEEQTQELRNKNLALEDINKNKNRFISVLTHDIKGPLASSMSLSEILVRKFDEYDNERKLAILVAMNQGLGNLVYLLENLVSWAKVLISGKVQLEMELLNITQLIRQSVKLFETNPKNVVVKNNIPNNIFLITDENFFDSIIRNLISNAVKYSYENGIVEISSEQNTKHLIITIKDYGVGMSKTQLRHLFAFSKDNTTPGTAGEKGSGLGLMNVYEFVKHLGGEIKAESKPNEYTIFTVTFPNIDS